MYNYQKFLQESKHSTNIKKLERMERQEEQHRAELAKQLISNHNKRIEHSVLTLIENPQKVHSYKDPTYKPREEDKSKRVVEGEMMYNYEKEPIRIIRNLHRNASLDLVPFKNSSINQFRGQASLEKTKTNGLEPKKKLSTGKESEIRTISRESKENKKEKLTLNKRMNKYPLLEKAPKTYFHTLQTIVNNPDSLKINIDEKGNESVSISMKHQTEPGVCNEIDKLKEEKVKNCKIALQKCGVIPEEETNTVRHSIMR